MPDQVRTPVDAFILARLEPLGLRLADEADRLTLLRRACFDLTGLPPTPEQIAAFQGDDRPDAYERVIDGLLASPSFGERWGRHWLDAAGYSDITGGDNDAGIIKLSEGKWKYRDYAVRAFNSDKPYERFLVEQLAGDELVDWRNAERFTPEIEELLAATGFLRNAADDTDEKELTTPDILHGVLQRTSEVAANGILGLTMACAKCHDHKYEPIAQREYYAFEAAFTPIYNPTAWVPPKKRMLADIAPKQKAAGEEHNAAIDRQIAALDNEQSAVLQPHRERLRAEKLNALPEVIRADAKAALELAADKRSEVQKYLADKFKTSLEVKDSAVRAALNDAEKRKLAELDAAKAKLNATRVTWGAIQAAYEVAAPPATHLLERGNHETPGPVVEPGFVAALCSKDNPPVANAEHAVGATSGRRLALAHWLTDWRSRSGGLAARVMTNRVWQHLFGRGIVETTENLGVSGAAPSHPELLDWLSLRFVSDGGRFKPLVKLLVMSSVYRQASSYPATPEGDAARALAREKDPANECLSHMPLRRLEAEIVRDAILAVGGNLDSTIGGPALALEVRPDGMVTLKSNDKVASSTRSRRSLYVLARRNYHLSMLGVFDQPAMTTNCPNRQHSAVVLQSLAMLNDGFVIEQAQRFAERVENASGSSAQAQINQAFLIALGRPPTAKEQAAAQELLSLHAAEASASGQAAEGCARQSLAHLCHMLLNSNEFLYVQ